MEDYSQEVVDALIEHIKTTLKKGSVTNVQVAAILDFLNTRQSDSEGIYLSKVKRDVAQELIEFLKGIIVTGESEFKDRTTFRKGLTAYSTSTEGAGNGITEGEESEILEIPANDIEMSLGELTNVDPSSDTAAEGAILVKGSDGIFYPNTTLITNLSNKVYTLDINDTPQNMFTLLNANRLKKFIVIGVNETDGSETFDAIVNYTPISIRVSWYEGFVFNTLLLEKIGDVIEKTISYINLIK